MIEQRHDVLLRNMLRGHGKEHQHVDEQFGVGKNGDPTDGLEQRINGTVCLTQKPQRRAL